MADAPEPASRPPGVVIESARPLSQSALWALNGSFYERTGVAAWATGEVPHLVTGGPLIARSYSRLVEGFCADVAAGRFGAADRKEPIYVIELGAGPGRLGFQLLHALDEGACRPLRVVYVLSDLAEKNVEFWRHHAGLLPFVEAGRLDFARFDASAAAEIHLEVSGVALRPGALANPLVVIANYLFDVIPQDLYAVDGGVLYEEELALCAEDPPPAASDPQLLRKLFVAPRRVVVAPGRYGDHRDAVLAAAAAEREGRFLFPAAPLLMLEHLLDLSGRRLLVLVGERPGAVPEETLEARLVEKAAGVVDDIPAGPVTLDVDGTEAVRPGALLAMGVHGRSFSLPVDLDLLARPVIERGGSLLLPEALPAGLIVAAILADGGAGTSTRRAFRHAVAELGPEDLWLTIRAALDAEGEGVNLAMLLAVLRVGGYDPYLLRRVYKGLEVELSDALEEGLDETVRVLRRTYELDFPIDTETDVAYGIAAMLAPAGRYEDALWFFERSAEAHGARPVGLFNVALCRLHLEDPAAALAALDEAIALDPGYAAAISLRTAVLAGTATPD